MGIWEVNSKTLQCARIVDKNSFKSTRGKFRDRRGGVVEESGTSKDMKRE